jgi:Protein of unknown function (DUF2652)
MQNPTLIFIPDISGFTEFVNTTAIEHSQHIISELLEIIINANNLNFTISEIEGDAVLFYKKASIPKIEDIIEQSKEMFLLFHKHLNEIEKSNVCQCGACRTASSLSLKFITHFGDIKEVSVKQFNELIGSDLILAHRLLKNSIKSNEYLLFSDRYYENFSSKMEFDDWIILESNTEEIEKFGIVSTKFINFKPLLSLVPQFIKDNQTKNYARNPDILVTIEAPILLVHDKLTDANAKYEYVPGIKKIETKDKINKINSSHTCVFDNLEIHFVTKSNTVENNKIAYSEEAELEKGFRFITDYRLQELNGKTELAIYIFKPQLDNSVKESIIKKAKDYFMLKFVIFNNRKGIKYLKNYCEKIHQESIIKKK